jgi:hypothetical protein
MVTEIRIYYEGNKALKAGFGVFFSEIRRLANAHKCSFQLISTGSKGRRISVLRTEPTLLPGTFY